MVCLWHPPGWGSRSLHESRRRKLESPLLVTMLALCEPGITVVVPRVGAVTSRHARCVQTWRIVLSAVDQEMAIIAVVLVRLVVE
jgi:hypothetical protein